MGHWTEPDLPEKLAAIVPHGTLDRLSDLSRLVKLWNPRINLVSKATIDDLWHRHIIDSLQILPEGEGSVHWCDLGSGGGFPGLVIAAARPEMKMTLVESDQRKAAFLLVAMGELGLAQLSVETKRIEALAPQGADVISARALAPLADLLGLVHRHMAPQGKAVLLKGRAAAQEIADANRHWDFRLEQRSSITDADATVLVVTSLTRRGDPLS
jgi:16S rRNA (guanine527-N7)-methyltransferase